MAGRWRAERLALGGGYREKGNLEFVRVCNTASG